MAVASLSPGEGNAATSGGGGDKVPLDEEVAVDVKDAEGVPVIALDGKGAASAQGVLVVTAVDGNGEAPVVEGVQEIAALGNDEAEEEEEGVKWLKHYSSMQSILIIGDGDFSFSRALATAFGSGENLVATSLDSYATLKDKYSKAESNIMELRRMGTTVLHGIDAKKMKLHTDLKMRWFDRIVFNFPHAGFKGKEDQVHMINLHKDLVRSFFDSARHLLRPYGEIHVSHKVGQPYDRWDIEQLAAESSLVLVEKVTFQKEDYPGYNQKRGDGAKCDQPFILGACRTFKFCLGNVKKPKKVRGNRIGSISTLGGSNVHPDTIHRGPFHRLSPVPAWPPPHFPPPVRTARVPTAPEPNPFGVARRQHPDFPVNFDGTARAPYFHRQGTIWPMLRIPEPPLNVLPALGGIPSPNQEQPWYRQRPTVDPLGGGDYSYFAREYQRSLQREYEIHRQVMPGGTSLDYSVFLEHRFRESAEKQEWLRRMIAFYGRQ